MTIPIRRASVVMGFWKRAKNAMAKISVARRVQLSIRTSLLADSGVQIIARYRRRFARQATSVCKHLIEIPNKPMRSAPMDSTILIPSINKEIPQRGSIAKAIAASPRLSYKFVNLSKTTTHRVPMASTIQRHRACPKT